MRSVADTFSKGEVVWLHNPQRMEGLSPKLRRPWEGPYVVVHRVNDVEYGIQRGPWAKPKVVHRDGLWKYHGEARAYWFTESPGEPVEGVPEETPMHRETLAMMTTGMRYPADAGGEENYPQIQRQPLSGQ